MSKSRNGYLIEHPIYVDNPVFNTTQKIGATYAWEGGSTGELHAAFFDRPWPNVGDVVVFPPVRLQIIGQDGFVFTVTTAPRPRWWARLRWQLHAAWLPIKLRVIWTFAVWGLARADWGAIPAWRDIYAVRKFADALHAAWDEVQRAWSTRDA